MNLRGIANSVTRAVNPNVEAAIIRSNGYATRPDGVQVPAGKAEIANCQVQALSFSDLAQLDGLNIQGVRKAIYVNGTVAATIRAAQKGGDVLQFKRGSLPEGTNWLVVHVLEQWQDGASGAAWAKFACTLQDGS